MPVPPRDMTAELQTAGVRLALFHRISPLYKFVAPGALVLLQRELERGNDLVLMLSETAWAHLMCLPEPAAVMAVTEAMFFGSCRNASGANAVICSVGIEPVGVPNGAMPYGVPNGAMPYGVPNGAMPYGVPNGAMPYGVPNGAMPYGVPMFPAFMPPGPPTGFISAPSRHERRHGPHGPLGPARACENAPVDSADKGPNKGLPSISWDATRKEVAALVRMCNGSIDAADVRPVASRLEALGPSLAARVVRETGIRVLSNNLVSKDDIIKAMKGILKKFEF